MQKAYFQIQETIPEKDRLWLLKHLQMSNLIGKNQLNQYFAQSQGFGVVFTKKQAETVQQRFPYIRYFQEMMPQNSPFSDLKEQANAFYWNCLVLEEGQEVKSHIDGTLQDYFKSTRQTKQQTKQQTYSQVRKALPILKQLLSSTLKKKQELVIPAWVSVLYLQAPRDSGFFELFLMQKRLLQHSAKKGQVCHFRGDLNHAVTPIASGAGKRISLVQENYILTDEQLKKLQKIQIKSRHSGIFAPIKQQNSNILQKKSFSSFINREFKN